MTTHLNLNEIKEYQKEFKNDPMNIVLSNAYANNQINNLIINHEQIHKINHIFTLTIDTKGAITSQGHSGRCWMFGGLNMLRRSIIKNHNLDDNFELSQNYLFFWDKMERCNVFMEKMIKLKKKSLYNEAVVDNLRSPVSDGGHWQTFLNLINKYGIVPKTIFDDMHSSRNSSKLNKLLNHLLRQFAIEIRSKIEAKNTDLREIKKGYIKKMYKILCMTIGMCPFPNESFNWIYSDKNKNKFILRDLNPIQFYEDYVKINCNNYVHIRNDPRSTHPYFRLYRRSYKLGMTDGKKVVSMNLPIKQLKDLVVKQLENNQPVWFACDVDKYVYGKNNLMDIELFNYGLPFGSSFSKMSKADRLNYKDSRANHVMAFTGVDIKDHHKEFNINYYKEKEKEEKEDEKNKEKEKGEEEEGEKKSILDDGPLKYIKWKVENSWGSCGSQKGYYTMMDSWFDKFVYEIVVHIDHLDKEQIRVLQQKDIIQLHVNDTMDQGLKREREEEEEEMEIEEELYNKRQKY